MKATTFSRVQPGEVFLTGKSEYTDRFMRLRREVVDEHWTWNVVNLEGGHLVFFRAEDDVRLIGPLPK